MSSLGRACSAIVFFLTVFLSAFLLFQVQPLISKFILPWFGGSPAVWTTCMLFFQVTLFGGYLYAHVLVSKLPPVAQAGLHLVLMVVAACLLPIAPDPGWKPTDANDPVGRILLLLTVSVGLPYFVLSTTGPLLQGWFARALPGRSPYRLYALSNIGSLLALLSYPFLVEPRWATEQQATYWSAGFVAFAVLCVICAVIALRSRPISTETNFVTVSESRPVEPAGGLVLLWIALAAVPSAMLLAVTNQVCTDIAVVPFLWVVPLALYLLTFILCFESDRWYRRRIFTTGLVLTVIGATIVLWGSTLNWASTAGFVLQGSIYFGLLFCSCMVCHGELVTLKPAPAHLTLFYLCMSFGGALGGLFVGLFAPHFFKTLFELPVTIVANCVVLMVVLWRETQRSEAASRSNVPAGLLGAFAVVIGASLWLQADHIQRNALASSRNFYGTLRVKQQLNERTPEHNAYVLQHGQIRHGHQYLRADRRRLPTSFYGPHSGGGIAVAQHKSNQPKRVGVIGLGTGTLAVYGQTGDDYRLYEINPDVVTLAREHFTYLSECRAKHDVVIEDGRIALEHEAPNNFDVLVLDAFSGDSIPTHLLTRDCAELYMKHLASDGILACHITNRHVDLRPVCQGIANEFQLHAMAVLTDRERDIGTSTCVWVLMSRDAESLNALKLGKGREITFGDAEPIVWTDAFTNLLSVLQPKGMRFELAPGRKKLATTQPPASP